VTAKAQTKIGLVLSLMAIFTALDLLMVATTWAQSPIDWTDPIVLSEVAASWSRPAIVATSWGHVHVFWAEQYGTRDSASEQGVGRGDTLYHAYWDGQKWSEPLDIILTDPNAHFMAYPYATVGKDAEIYLTWSGVNALYFSRAPALNAHHAASWQPAQTIVEGQAIDQSCLVIGTDGRIHVVYAQHRGELGGSVAYTWSSDQGLSWSLAQAISEIFPDEDKAPAEPKMVLDNRGWLHIVWTERSAPDWVGHGILYARSEDEGETWTSPESLAALELDEKWADTPSLVVTSEGQLHLVWSCGVGSPHRCYRTSADGGRSWAPKEDILGGLVGSGGWDAMVADHQGNLHFVGLLRYPEGIYYAFKSVQGAWQPIRIVDRPDVAEGHFFQLALSNGNQLHAVWQRSAREGDIVYVRITTSAPALRPSAIPTVASPSKPAPSRQISTPVETSMGAHQEHAPVPSVLMTDDTESRAQSKSPLLVLFWTILPSVALIALVVGIRVRSRLH